jgi:subtilisin-like proprotein convertase family protein
MKAKQIMRAATALLFLGFILIAGNGALAQSNCANAILLTVGANPIAPGAVANAASGTPLASCQSAVSQLNYWARFVATSTSATVTAVSNRDLVIQVLSGSCGSQTQLGCSNSAGNGAAATFNSESVTVTGLTIGTTYYIRLANGLANTNAWSIPSLQVYNPCSQYFINPNTAIPDASSGGINSTIVVSGTGSQTLTDLNVRVTIPNHTFIGDLIIKLTSPTGTIVTLWNQSCSGNDGMQVTFDDQGSSVVCAQPTIGTYIPAAALSAFNGQVFAGNWVLNVSDNASGDIGHLADWCMSPSLTTPCTPPNSFNVTGGGSYCSGGGGVAVGLSGSQVGASYQLRLNGSPTGSPITGAGSSFNFPNQTSAGTYTVVATFESCTATMTGNAVVTVLTVPSCAASGLSPANGATGVCHAGVGAVSTVSWSAVSGATSYDVYFEAGNSNPVFIGNQSGTSYSTGALAANTTYYWKRVPRNSCGPATGCSVFSFTTGCLPCACYAGNTSNTNARGIEGVLFGSINNAQPTTGGDPDYTDYTCSQSTEVYRGQSLTLTVTLDDNNNLNTMAWFDWNQNGIFGDDGTDGTYVLPGSGASGVVNTFITVQVPTGAAVGTTRMRVFAQVTSYPPSCTTTAGNGEAEDYTVDVISAVPCAGTPTPGSAASSSTTVDIAESFTLSLTGVPTVIGLTYQWQSSPNNSTWTNISGATSASLVTSESASTYYRCVVTCSNSNLSDNSESILVNCTGNLLMIRNGTGSATLCSGNFYDSGGPSVNYFNNENDVMTLTPSSPGSLMQINFSSYSSESGFDYITIYNNNSASGTILLGPASGTLSSGLIVTANSSGNPTGSLTVVFSSDASVRDAGWAATVSCLSACSATPVPGNTISSINPVCPNTNFILSLQNSFPYSGIGYQWQSSANNTDWNNISGATSSTLTRTQTASTYYRCIVTCSSGPSTGTSTSIQVGVDNSVNCLYCTPSSTFGCSEFGDEITRVRFASTIDRSSGCDEYVLIGSPVPNVLANGTTPYSLIINTGVGNLTDEGVAVWIDFNHDGTFSTPGERVYSSYSGNDPATYSTNLIFSNSLSYFGITRMRIRCGYAAAPTDPCSATSYGETEDYLINIVNPCTNFAAGGTTSGPTAGCRNAALATIQNEDGNGSHQWEVNINDGGWDAIPSETSSTLSYTPTVAGNFQFRDNRNTCSQAYSNSISVTVFEPTSVSASPSQPSVCLNGSSVSLSGSPSGGDFTGNGVSGSSFIPASAGVGPSIITYTYTDANACVSSALFTIDVLSLPVPLPTNNGPKCEGTAMLLQAGITAASYAWTGPAFAAPFNYTGANTQNPSFTNVQVVAGIAGTYSLTITDNNGCTSSASTTMTVYALPTAQPSIPASPACQGTSVTLVGNAITTGAPIASNGWIWTGPSYNSTTLQSPVLSSVTTANAGNYTLRVRDTHSPACLSQAVTVPLVVNTPATFTAAPAENSNIAAGNNDAGLCSKSNVTYTVTWSGSPSPTVSYSFAGATSSAGFQAGTGSGSTFNVGVTDVYVQLSNVCASPLRHFTITIIDNQNPVITTIALNQNVTLDGACAIIVPNLVAASAASDNCSAMLTQVPTAGTVISSSHNQTHNVVVTATDPSNNSVSQTVVLTAKDLTNPTITTCASNQNVNLSSAVNTCNLTVPNLVAQSAATDNCTVTLTQSPVAGTLINTAHNATHTVTIYATDAAGNQVSCNTVLTAKDVTAPTLTCPASYSTSFIPGTCLITVSNPTHSDNCAVVSLTWTITGPTTLTSASSGINYVGSQNLNLGANVITYTAKDIANNTTTCSFTVTVLPVNLSTTLTVTPGTKQYSDQVTFTARIPGGNSTCGPVAAASATFFLSSPGQNMGTAPYVASGADLVATLTISLLDASLVSGTPPAGPMAPGNHTVTVVNNSVDAHYAVANTATAPLTITKEDAVVEYTGNSIQATPSSSSTTATVVLTAKVQDNSLTDLTDTWAGDVRNARVKFINRDLNTDISGWLTPVLVGGDPRIGTVSYSYVVNLGSGDNTEIAIGVIVDNGYYTRNSSDDNFVLTVYKPVGDFITGGGFIKPINGAGTYAPDANKNTNFGFNVHFNNRGTNLQGNMNFIFRRTVSGVPHTYQIKANAMVSLGVNVSNPNRQIAQYVSKANLTDVTNPLAPVSLGGNLGMYVNITDNGEPGTNDSISIALTNSYNNPPTVLANLLYCANWVSNANRQMRLYSGNTVVHSGFSLKVDEQEESEAVSTLVIENSDEIMSVAYPNPFTESTNILFSVPQDAHHALVEVYSVTGAKVGVLFDMAAESGNQYKVTFNSANLAEGIYTYRITCGDHVFNGKLVLMK